MKTKQIITAAALAMSMVACNKQNIGTEADAVNATEVNVGGQGSGPIPIPIVVTHDSNTGSTTFSGLSCAGGGAACGIETSTEMTTNGTLAYARQDATRSAMQLSLSADNKTIVMTVLEYGKAQAAYMANADVLKALNTSLGTAANSTATATVGNMKFAYGSTSLSQALRLGLMQNLYSNYADVKEAFAKTGNPLYQSRPALTDAAFAYNCVSVVKPAKAAVEVAFGEALAKSPASDFPAKAYQMVSVVRPAKAASPSGGEARVYNMVSVVKPAKVLQGLGSEMIAAGVTVAGKKLVENAEARWDGYVVKFLTADNFDTETELLGNLSADEYKLLAKAGVLQKFRKLWYRNLPVAMGLTANRPDFTHLTVVKDMTLSGAVAKALGVASLTLKAGSYAYTTPTTVTMKVEVNVSAK